MAFDLTVTQRQAQSVVLHETPKRFWRFRQINGRVIMPKRTAASQILRGRAPFNECALAFDLS
jgi:hypothetical protein